MMVRVSGPVASCSEFTKCLKLIFIAVWQSIHFFVVKQAVIAVSPRKALQQPKTKTNITMKQ